ncbi:MAG TPA: LCP family protein [Aggregatilineaceae bacterium]|nr:LCP family protein [Anaerolineae bacterium]HMM28962.1 LCP family protein [Aggregatilineaceae bacterium]
MQSVQRPPAERRPPAPYGYFPPPAVRRRRGCCTFSCLILLLVPIACFGSISLLYFAIPPQPLDIVILGVDARDGEGWMTRTDSVMLLNITPRTLDVSLLSIPRDVFIRVPGYGEQRINTINVLGEQETPGSGGPALVKASLQESFGVGVDRYVRLDFDAFVELIDAVGGVTIDVPKRIVDYEFPTRDGGTIQIEFEPGRQKMDGERALQYARTRHQDDDYQRAGRQQQVVDALVRKLSNPAQVVRWPRVLYVLRAHTDTDLSVWNMLEAGPALLLGWSGRESRVLERDDLIGMAAGYWVPDYDALAPWIAEQFD